MGELRTCINYGIVGELVVLIPLQTTYLDRFIKSKHPAEGKHSPHCTPPVPILLVPGDKSEAEIDWFGSFQEVVRGLAQLETLTKD